MKPWTVLALLMTLSLEVHAAEIYKWIDKNGVPSFGERPPEGVEYIKLKLGGIRNPPPQPRQSAPSSGPSSQAKQLQPKGNTAPQKAKP